LLITENNPEIGKRLDIKDKYFNKENRQLNAARSVNAKGAITSKIKHAIKLKTSPARLAHLLQPSLAFCFSLQPMTAYRPALERRHWLQAKTKC